MSEHIKSSKRLIAFGCSLTYGQGLPDCHVAPSSAGYHSSQYSWPEILARLMSLTCVNLSRPGSSNKRIWHEIVNFKFESTDIVYILWSYPVRSTILKNKNNAHDINPWKIEIDKISREFYNQYTAYDMLIQSKLCVNHSYLFLNSIGVESHNLVIEKKFLKLLKLNTFRVPHIPVFIDEYVDRYPLALDNGHPGVECHEQFAKDIFANREENKMG